MKSFIAWCREVIAEDGHVILDTETTALDGEIIELAVLSMSGRELYNKLLRPRGTISTRAMETHNITEAMVQSAPTIAQEWDKICELLMGKTIITYNAKFDSERIAHSLDRYGLVTCTACSWSFECAMIRYAQFWSAPPKWGRSTGPAWQSLSTACYQQGVTLPPNFHRAMPDCQATLALLCKVAATGEDSPRYKAI